MNHKLKKIIFKKLYQDLSGVEIIQHKDSIWFINRENRYWYLRYDKNGELRWRYPFFINFFCLFSMEKSEFQLVISEWVEEVLNCKIYEPLRAAHTLHTELEEVLNCKVTTPTGILQFPFFQVEEVLKCKVTTPSTLFGNNYRLVEEVLKCKVTTPYYSGGIATELVEEVLKCKITTSTPLIGSYRVNQRVEEVLKCKVTTSISQAQPLPKRVEEVLKCKVETPYSQ